MRVCALAGIAVVVAATGLNGQERIGNWVVESDTDPITDQSMKVAAVDGQRGNLLLALACRDGRRMIALQLTNPTDRMDLISMSDLPPTVTYRVDQHEPSQRTPWQVAEDHSVLMIEDPKAENFILEITSSRKLAARIFKPGSDGRVTTDIFDTQGVKRALEELPCAFDGDWPPE